MIKCPSNNLLVQVESRYQDEIKLEGGGKLFRDTTFNPEWHATIAGKVISNPGRLTKDLKNDGVTMELQPGDEAFFSYKVISDHSYQDNRDEVFHKVIDNAVKRVFKNNRGETIVITRTQETQFAGILIDKSGDIADRWIGTKEEVKKWTQNFDFEDSTVIFPDNLLIIAGEEFWKVDYSYVFGYKRGEKIAATAGFVWAEPIEEYKMTFNPDSLILAPDMSRKITKKGKAIARYIGNNPIGEAKTTIHQGETIIFNPAYAEQYEINGRNWLILRTNRILAVEN